MTKTEKSRSKIALRNEMRHADVHTYLTSIGATCRINGSHHVYTLPNNQTISIPLAKGGTAKAEYIKQLDIRLTEMETP